MVNATSAIHKTVDDGYFSRQFENDPGKFEMSAKFQKFLYDFRLPD